MFAVIVVTLLLQRYTVVMATLLVAVSNDCGNPIVIGVLVIDIVVP